MHIEPYSGKYDKQIIDLILSIQNNEAKINLSLEEQPDLMDIHRYYQQADGEFFLAMEGETVIGTLAIMLRENNCAVMKKFFVRADYRSKKVGLALYERVLAFAQAHGVQHMILDTPSVAHAAHRFYERAGFRKITADELPVPYSYPDRDSLLYLLDL